jgi:hypothetical protein
MGRGKESAESAETWEISFEMASLVFEDERCLVGLESVDETGEERGTRLARRDLNRIAPLSF